MLVSLLCGKFMDLLPNFFPPRVGHKLRVVVLPAADSKSERRVKSLSHLTSKLALSCAHISGYVITQARITDPVFFLFFRKGQQIQQPQRQ